MNLSCPSPDGGFYLFPNFSYYRASLEQRGSSHFDNLSLTLFYAVSGIQTGYQLCDAILENTGITLLPGEFSFSLFLLLTSQVQSLDWRRVLLPHDLVTLTLTEKVH